MIPGENEWTVIFSKNSTSWGSFTYDQKEDALRVAVKPQPAEFHEALTYDFDDVKPDSSTVMLRWETIAVPFKVAVNLNDVVQQSLNQQLRGLGQYTWFGWDDAATYLVDNKGNLDEALKYSNNSIQNEERYENLFTKSRVLDAMGKKDEATAAKNKALAKANAIQLHSNHTYTPITASANRSQGGISTENMAHVIMEIHTGTGAREFHFSAGEWGLLLLKT